MRLQIPADAGFYGVVFYIGWPLIIIAGLFWYFT